MASSGSRRCGLDRSTLENHGDWPLEEIVIRGSP